MSTFTNPPQVAQPEDSTGLPPAGKRTESNDDTEHSDTDGKKDKQDGKRRLFGLLKKKDKSGSKSEGLAPENAAAVTSTPKPTDTGAVSPQRTPSQEARQIPSSPRSIVSAAASPSRRIRTSSPGLHSPASSLIFERNVQEQPLPDEVASKLPHHIQTEDRIPAVLEASSLAITDDHLNPDEVEIVSLQAHQPAEATVPGHTETASGTLSPMSIYDDTAMSSSFLHEPSENTSNYGSYDAADVRRLSFISFADVVQSEHADHNKEMHMSFSSTANRSPSPIRSPASSHGFGPSPPTSGAPSVKGVDIASRLPGSPTSHGTHSPPLQTGGELMVETMRQALRKTGSGDLSGARSPANTSQPMSAVSLEDAHADQPPFHRLQ